MRTPRERWRDASADDAPDMPAPPAPGWLKSAEPIWTILTVEPLAVRLAPMLARRASVTPNRITATAAVLGVTSALSFALGALLLGGLLFQLRYVADCLDGKVARLRGVSSERGAAFDIMVDVLTITANYAALSSYLVRRRGAPTALDVAAVGTSLVFAWLLLYRKTLQKAGFAAGLRAGPSILAFRPWAAYLNWMTRHRTKPLPYSVEAEMSALCLGPVADAVVGEDVGVAIYALWVTSLFYVCAAVINGVRIWRLAGAIDSEAAMGTPT